MDKAISKSGLSGETTDELVMNQTVGNFEALSALADGELTGPETAAVVQATVHDVSLRAAWQHYHLIGDVLRLDVLRSTVGDARTALHAGALTPLSTQPVALSVGSSVAMAQPMTQSMTQPVAANDSVWRWKLVAGFAAVAAVGSIVWSLAANGLTSIGAGPVVASSAQSNAVVVSASISTGQQAEQVMIRDPRLDELLAAHKQFGGASALQPAGFLRNATFQTPQR